jgi:hypothetical protein
MLQNQTKEAIPSNDVVDKPNALCGFYQQRGHHPRKHDNIGKTEYG